MAKFLSVEEYLSAQREDVRAELEKVRAVIRKALPKAEEGISYNIPAYKVDGVAVIYFAGWKAHWSLYPVTERVREQLGDAIAGYEVSKGTLRFPLGARVPVGLVTKIVKLRAKEAAARGR